MDKTEGENTVNTTRTLANVDLLHLNFIVLRWFSWFGMYINLTVQVPVLEFISTFMLVQLYRNVLLFDERKTWFK